MDRNEYNHITATYFLLAERKLRAQRQIAAKKLKSPQSETGPDESSPIRGRTGSNPSSPNKKHKESIPDASSSSIV